ncbi:MAG TPA: M1 family aminopeptidase [Candidatus Polarisedimenticolia bacterium]|nr:M1 family aminopeptidase [Candidatus Polarisedimenticolia bacterium]
MLARIFAFEFRYQFRQPLIWIASILYFILIFFAITSDAVSIGGSIGAVNRNAPFVIMQMLAVMTILGTFFTTAFVSNSVHRDFELQTDSIFFSTPLKKTDYLLGRFAGSLFLSWFSYVAISLGIFVGSLMPWLEAERVGPFQIGPYVFAMLVFVIPNMFITGALFFSLATLTRNLLYTYAGVVVFVVGVLTAVNLIPDLEYRTLASLIDPYGLNAFEIQARYWTVLERNSLVPTLTGNLLLNRLLWCGLAAVVLAFTVWRFRMTVGGTGRASRQLRQATTEGGPSAVAPARAAGATGRAFAPVRPSFSRGTAWAQYLHQARLETRSVLRGIPFVIMTLFGLVNVTGATLTVESIAGTPVWPVTAILLPNIIGSFILVVLLVLIFYSGDLVWRERTLRMSEMFDALPMPTWTVWTAKLTALAVSIVALMTAVTATGVAVQSYRHYTNYELPVYFKGLFVLAGSHFLFLAVACLFFQAVCNNKFVAWLLSAFIWILGMVLPALHLEHLLYRFMAFPQVIYSDMNGFRPFNQLILWTSLYWGFFCIALLAVAHLLWVRGTEPRLRLRLRVARQRLTAPVRVAFAVAVVGIIGSGSWIFYNTNVLNRYIPQDRQFDRQADYEKKYKKYEDMEKPRITDAKVDVDIFPERRTADMRGGYVLKNKTAAPIDVLHVGINPDVVVRRLDVPNGRIESEDKVQGYRIYKLDPPLAPGATMELTFDVSMSYPGFANSGARGKIVQNGTFFDSTDFLPHLGYQKMAELDDPNERRKRGLPPIVRFAKVDDLEARRNTYISNEADWVNFETTVSTSADQIALAPGNLQREWSENGRHYYHYRTDAPILNFYGWLSGRYAVKRDRWNDVSIEVYYHPGHPYNIDRMLDGAKKSLQYFSDNFGPYQHKELRIVEFPRYARFAQALPNTIPFSESIGFIGRIADDPDAIDYVFYVTAHEVGHMWWAHQVMGANVQGATLMSETMAQYSALMVMEHEYGRDKMRRFLKYELDSYLAGRGAERIEEMPLYLVENQPYIHYRKGSLIMYALRDAVGEQPLNAALREYVQAVKFQQPPYTNSPEFLDSIAKAVPADKQALLDDLFRNITLYENRATKATWAKRDDGKYVVTLQFASAKYRADGKGKETERPMDDWVDVGVFGEKGKDTPQEGKVLLLEKRHLAKGEDRIEVVVDELPKKAGIDPFNKLIDRNPENNIMAVAAGGPALPSGSDLEKRPGPVPAPPGIGTAATAAGDPPAAAPAADAPNAH